MAITDSVTQLAPSCTEQELVAAVRRGSDRAFEELYSRYRSRISAYIFGMVGDHGRAEDIAQEVFISALHRLRDTERPIAFRPWIYEIAKNACIDEFRRSRRTREVSLEPDGGHSELAARGPTPDAAVQNKQSLDDLRGAFHGLSENHHKIIVMRELEGLSYSQIGEKLGISRPMVESTLFRARRRLTEEYNELVSGRRCEQVQTLIEADERRSLMTLGVRERRQLARHLAHCQPCRRVARMAGVDETFFKAPKTLAGKIAALLPFPWLRWRRSNSSRTEDAGAAAGSHSYAAMQSVQTVARLADPAGPGITLGRAAAAAAAIAVAGIGSGVVSSAVGNHGRSAASRARASAISRTPGTAVTGAPVARSGSQRVQGGTVAVGSAVGAGTVQSPGAPNGASGSSAPPAAQQPGRLTATAGGGTLGTGGNVAGGNRGPTARIPSRPSVKLPVPQLPNLKTGLPPPLVPKIQLPKLSLPKLSQVMVLKVPGGSSRNPNKVISGFTHHG